jgi:hypothetical protein
MSVKRQKKRKHAALMEEVRAIATRLENVISVSTTGLRRCCGNRKVKVPTRWEAGFPVGTVPFTVSDGDNGECDVIVKTTKPGAIARIVGKRLKEQGIHVC